MILVEYILKCVSSYVFHMVDHKGGAGTAADIEYDYGAEGCMSCHV